MAGGHTPEAVSITAFMIVRNTRTIKNIPDCHGSRSSHGQVWGPWQKNPNL